MKNNLFLCILLSWSCTSCIAVSNMTYQMDLTLRKEATIKVINPNTQDIILGKLEHALLNAGWVVISDNRLHGSTPTGV